jgi:hypothetical protein
MPCPCCDEWPCAQKVAEDEARWEAAEDERRALAAEAEEDPDLDSLAETPEGQDWTPMERESPDFEFMEPEERPGIELGGEGG